MRTALFILALLSAPLANAQPSDDSADPRTRVDPRVNERIVVDATGPRSTTARPGDLVPVEPRVDDVGGSLSTSTRLLPLDLRVPMGFDRVYRMHGLENTLVRSNGALVAVFNHSEYSRDDEGNVRTHVPAGAEFYIGAPSAIAAQLLAIQARNLAAAHLPQVDHPSAAIAPMDPSRIQAHIATRTSDMPMNMVMNMRVDPAASERDIAEPRVMSDVPQWMVDRDFACASARTILTDEAYAESRVRELLEQAARSHSAGSSSSAAANP